MLRFLVAALSLVVRCSLVFILCASHAAANPMSEVLGEISKPELKLNAVEQEIELLRVQSALKTMRNELLRELGSVYDKSMVTVVLRSAPVSNGEVVPTKAWWDTICEKIYGAAPGDVSDAMSPEEIENVVSEKVTGAKEKTMEDIDSLLQQSVDEEWGKSVKIGFAANCDLSSNPPFSWSDPTVVDLGDELDRSGTKSSKTKTIANWDVADEATSSSEFERELGKASFGREHDGGKQALVQAEMHSAAKVKLAVGFGIGMQKLRFDASKTSDSRAGNNPDQVEFLFSEP